MIKQDRMGNAGRMNAGYVRLSRDDEKKNYVSIENQRLIIRQYAADHGVVIDRWYEDDGISGYIFERPGFQQMMADLDRDIDTVYVKDFSRLGRHNAKVLLLLDEFRERGRHLIVIDDHYDSMDSGDDTVGIKTWFNERYVKDTSQKIKRAIGAKQKAGTLITRPPFGYRRNAADKTVLEIVPMEAELIKKIFDLYLSGSGYRRIAAYLTGQGVPTPSMIQHERELKEGLLPKRRTALQWSDAMVKEILNNDFYTGTLRLKKRARNTVHGKDKRVPEDEQYMFENHHPAVIEPSTFALVQELKSRRCRSNYRGSRRQSSYTSPFGSCLFCKDCGSRLTPIRRLSAGRERKYYICTTYNTRGRRYCAKSHLIEEDALMRDVLAYIRMCRNVLCEEIRSYDLKAFDTEGNTLEGKRQELYTQIHERKEQLKALLTQKVRDLAAAPGNEALICETYDSMQKELLAQLHGLQIRQTELENADTKMQDVPDALSVLDKLIEGGCLDRRDIELLIDRIVVDQYGMPEISLRYGLSCRISHSPANDMNHGGELSHFT